MLGGSLRQAGVQADRTGKRMWQQSRQHLQQLPNHLEPFLPLRPHPNHLPILPHASEVSVFSVATPTPTPILTRMADPVPMERGMRGRRRSRRLTKCNVATVHGFRRHDTIHPLKVYVTLLSSITGGATSIAWPSPCPQPSPSLSAVSRRRPWYVCRRRRAYRSWRL